METLPSREQFLWQTMEGEVLSIDQMKTGHIFNSMKMLFNHLAAEWGGKPIWFRQEYTDYREKAKGSPSYIACLIVFFISEIERRQDLPAKYVGPYHDIISQIRPRCLPGQLKLLPAATDSEPIDLPF